MILKCASFPIQNDPESWDLPRCQVDADSHGKRRSAEAGKNRGFSGRQCRDRFHRTDAHGTICVDSEGIGGAAVLLPAQEAARRGARVGEQGRRIKHAASDAADSSVSARRGTPSQPRGAAALSGQVHRGGCRAGISPRAVPGVPGHIFVAATDEHDEDGTLISDEFTNPHKRRLMVEKRARKMHGLLQAVAPPRLVGPENAAVTLVGWGSTESVIREAVEKLAGEEGIVANQLHIKWVVPFHAVEVNRILSRSRHVIIVENNYSGQFARYLRGETGFDAQGHIRKYDGEPFMPHHIVEAVKEQLAGRTRLSVPVHEVIA